MSDCVSSSYIYEPREDSFLIRDFIRKNRELFFGKSVLDMGSGSGILALESSKYADKVLAVDINKVAVSRLKSLGLNAVCSDLFSNVRSKFDIILFNPPYLPYDKREDSETALALSGGKHGYEIIERFLSDLNVHLKDEGFALLVFSSLTGRRIVDELVYKFGFSFELVGEKDFDFESLFLYKIVKQDFLKKDRLKFSSYLSKGKRSFVYSVYFRGKRAVVKVKKPGVVSNVVDDEFFWLSKLNKFSIGPKIFLRNDSFIVLEFIDGVSFIEFLKFSSSKSIRSVLRSVFEKLLLLDVLGIVKEEMSHPQKHLIISKNAPRLIDFERSHFSSKPKNLTQFLQFLTSSSISKLLSVKFSFDVEKIRNFAFRYKKSFSVAGCCDKSSVLRSFNSQIYFVDSLLSLFSEKSFYEQVYSLTALIPKGKVMTYSLVAKYLGSRAFRAVGTALHKNPYKSVPCHRVVKADGSVGGFAKGVSKKVSLLKSEGVTIEGNKIRNLENFLFKL